MPVSDLLRLGGAGAAGLRGSMQDLAAYNKQAATERHQAALERNAAAYVEIARAREAREAGREETTLAKLKQDRELAEMNLKKLREQQALGEQLVTAGTVVPDLARPGQTARLSEIVRAIEAAGGEVEQVDPEDPTTWRVQQKYIPYIQGLVVNSEEFGKKMNAAALKDLDAQFLDTNAALTKAREKGDAEQVKLLTDKINKINEGIKIARDADREFALAKAKAEAKGAADMAKEILKGQVKEKIQGIKGEQAQDLERLRQAGRKDLAKFKQSLKIQMGAAGLSPKNQLIMLDMTIGYENMSPQQQHAYDRVIGNPAEKELRNTIARILGPNLLLQTEDPKAAVQMFMQATEMAIREGARKPKVPGRPEPPAPGSRGAAPRSLILETRKKYPNLKGQEQVDAVVNDLIEQGYLVNK